MKGETQCQIKFEEPVQIPRLPWRIPSMTMSILNNGHNNDTDDIDKNDNDDNVVFTGYGEQWHLHDRVGMVNVVMCIPGRYMLCQQLC